MKISFAVFAFTLLLTAGARAQLVNSEWNVGNGNWNVPGNWFPSASAPDNGAPLVTNTYNVQIGNRPVAAGAQVDFVPVSGTSDTITSLTVSNNADLFTNGSRLNTLATTIVDGIGTTIRVDPHATPGTAALTSLDLNLNNGGGLTMAGGIVEVTRELEINAGSVLGGHGTVNVGDGDAVVEQAFENSSLLQVQGNTAAPQTLTIHANGVDTIDLDGATNAGVVDVDNALANVNADTVTLIIDGPLTEAFGGVAGATIQIGQRDTLTFNDNFTIAGPAAITMNGGSQVATLNGPGNITSIAGATFTITGAALIENDMAFNGTANVITVSANASLELGGAVVIPDASALVFSASSSQLIISGDTSVIELAGDFNWDGPGSAITTVEGAGTFTVNVNHVDTGDDLYGGTLNLNDNADVSVNTAANLWTMAGAINKNNAGASTVAGDTVIVTGAIAVNAGSLTMPVTTLNPTASIVANGTLVLGGGSAFAGPSSVTGSGTLRMASTSTVTANTTIGIATFDWDGTSTGSLHTINTGVVFTINSTTFDGDGDMDDPLSLGGNGGQLNINGVTNWTMAAALTTNPAAVGTATIGGSSRMTLAGAGASWTVTGNTTANAPVTFGSSATTIAAARTLRLAGGDNNTNTNVMAGGTIGGAGTLAANDARELRGFGNIGASIDFDNTARLRADDGTLTIAGAILDVGVIGTADADGVLNVTNAWNNNVAAGVALLGGTVQGGTITNDTAQGIQGFGTVTSRVINNTQLLSFNGGTLIFETAADDNDWDGAAGNGLLRASPGTTLDVRDSGPAFPFAGTVQVDAGARVFVNNPDDLVLGFGLNFLPAADLNLNGGTYEAASSTDLAGTTTVAAGPESTIKVRNNTFLTFASGSTITLNGNLRLENNNINVEDLANFSGAGSLKVVDGSHMVIDNNADVGVLLEMYGALRPGNSEGIGRANLTDYQQYGTGELFLELTGTSLNQFDRLSASGDVIVDGYLNIDLDAMFAPVLGNTFNIITGTNVTGQFDYYDVSGMPAGLAFHIEYLANAVQLQVVNKPIFAADFDDDGDVDGTDLAIWKGAFDLNQLGDADGDNDSDGADLAIWQREFGSHPGAGAGAFIPPVPEPTTLVLLSMALSALLVGRKRRNRNRWAAALVCCVSIVMCANASQAQSVSLSLDLLYNNPVNHAAGGTWLLVGKTSSVNGISLVNAIMSNINVAGISYQSGIGAMLDGGSPWVINNGTSVEVLYVQDFSTPASVVTDVGRGAGTPGNLAIDPLNDPAWNNAALIAKGTFGALKPAFVPTNDVPADVTEANVLTTKVAPFGAVVAAPLSAIVRESTLQLGDYNRNGTVDAADYVVWRETLGTGISLYAGADGSGNGLVDQADYTLWKSNFGAVASPGVGSSTAVVPEPASLVLLVGMLAIGAISRPRRTRPA